MKRFILPLLIIFIFISLPAKANDEVKTLLKVLDKSLPNKASYTQQKQRQIDSLKIILRQSRDIRKKVGTAQSLCFEYSSFQKDSALAYAIHMNRFAQESNDKELLIEAKLDYSRILSSMGFFKEALAITNSMQQKQLSPKLKAEYLWKYEYSKQIYCAVLTFFLISLDCLNIIFMLSICLCFCWI